MKVYVLGDDSKYVARVSNLINAAGHTAILSEGSPSSAGDILEDMVGNRSYNYDLTIAITDSPVELNIAVNRNGRYASAVCRNAQEAQSARKASANVVVLDADEGMADAGSIVKACLTDSVPSQTRQQIPAPKQPSRAASAVSNILSDVNPVRRKRQKVKEDDDDEDIDEPQKPKGKGLLESIKYTFGVD